MDVVKKRTFAIIGLLIFCIVLSCFVFFRLRIIGHIGGPEWDTLTVGNACYEKTAHSPFNRSDRSSFLGCATDGRTRFRIYEVKGSDEYLYCAWEWEGWLYRRIE